MKKLLIWLSLFTCSIAFGNPIAVVNGYSVYSGTKSSENCIAILGKNSSLVSCDVHYILQKAKSSRDSKYLDIVFPVLISTNDSTADEKLVEIFLPRIEFDGKVIAPFVGEKPMRIRDKTELQRLKAPAGTDIVFFGFTLEVGVNRQDFRLLVRYSQPMINGKFHYIALFEGNKAPTGKGPYHFEALTFEPSCRIASAKTPKNNFFASRMSFDLSKQNLIELELKKEKETK